MHHGTKYTTELNTPRHKPSAAYVEVFMYSLAGWSFVLPAVYAPACADSRSGLMSGCLCIHWPGGAGNGEIGLGTWVGLCHSLREKYNSRGYSFLMFTGISAENLSLYPRGTIPHIISNYPRAHYNAGLNDFARRYSTARLRIPPRVAYVSSTVM